MSVPSGTSRTSFKLHGFLEELPQSSHYSICTTAHRGRPIHGPELARSGEVEHASLRASATAGCKMDRKTREVFAKVGWGEEDLELGSA